MHMKIYFAAPIQKSKKSQVRLYKKIIRHLSHYGTVLTEKIGDENFHKRRQTKTLSVREIKQIYKFDSKLLLEADVMVAEVSIP